MHIVFLLNGKQINLDCTLALDDTQVFRVVLVQLVTIPGNIFAQLIPIYQTLTK